MSFTSDKWRLNGGRSHREVCNSLLLCIPLCILAVEQAYANRIYKSVDAEGNVTYSSVPPKDARRVERMHLPDDPSDAAATSSTYDDIRAAAEELEKDRKQREEQRESARKALKEKESDQQAQQPVVEHRHYYPSVPYYHYQRPHRPRPARPDTRPQPVTPRPRPYPRHRPESRPNKPMPLLGAG